MRLRRLAATRFEHVITEGRTHPLVLACRSDRASGPEQRFLVKAIGCPEVRSSWQLVTETVGNAIARRMGVLTPVPAVVEISDVMARLVNRSLEGGGHSFKIEAGLAAGCEFIPGLANFTVGQRLNPEMRNQAVRIFTFDMLSQNPDRRRDKVNCGLTKSGLIAFDFELCFAHKFLHVIGGDRIEPWEPSAAQISRNHLFYEEVKATPLAFETVEMMASDLNVEWWEALSIALPGPWRMDAERIGADLRLISSHAQDFAKDISTRCLL